MKLFFLSLFLLSSLQAKRFTSQYCEFELPNGWECALEGAEWVCQSTNKARKKEAIIILAAKVRGQKDSLGSYQKYLKGKKTYKLPGGKTQVSEAKYTRQTKIHNHMWIDSLHLASEVPGFYTRYLATVKGNLGVAVTFSVSKDHYNSYKEVFDGIIASLRVFDQKSVTKAADFKLRKVEENLFENATYIPDAVDQLDLGTRQKKQGLAGSQEDELIFWALIGLVGIILFIIIRKKRKK